MTDYGITAFGAYVPRLRLERTAIAAAHKWLNPALRGIGTRAFCSWDEDSITMAVEAARDCLAGRDRAPIAALRLASTTFPYADLSNAVIVASALRLPGRAATSNEGGSQRAATSALLQALRAPAGEQLVVASERPVTLPASAAELQAGAGAAAILLGGHDVVARLVGSATVNDHFVDHFRAADRSTDYGWEERWVRDAGHARLIPDTLKAALVDAGLEIGAIDHLILPIGAAAKGLARALGFEGKLADAYEAHVGHCGAAQPLMMLAGALETAEPGERIAVVGFGQGVDILIFEATEAIAAGRSGRGMAGAVADELVTGDYLRMLSFYDRIALDWGMRGEKAQKPALTEHHRESGQLDSFTGGKCGACGAVQFPVLAYCVNPACAAAKARIEPHALADEPARIFTITSDWLSYHPAPPLAVGFVQFDVGARVLMEVVDAAPAQLAVGEPVRMVFRIKERDRARGYNRYFWKATPLAAPETDNG